jgi:hypothetical protein
MTGDVACGNSEVLPPFKLSRSEALPRFFAVNPETTWSTTMHVKIASTIEATALRLIHLLRHALARHRPTSVTGCC